MKLKYVLLACTKYRGWPIRKMVPWGRVCGVRSGRRLASQGAAQRRPEQLRHIVVYGFTSVSRQVVHVRCVAYPLQIKLRISNRPPPPPSGPTTQKLQTGLHPPHAKLSTVTMLSVPVVVHTETPREELHRCELVSQAISQSYRQSVSLTGNQSARCEPISQAITVDTEPVLSSRCASAR